MRKKCPYSQIFWSVFFRIQTEYGGVSLRIQSEWGNVRTRITPNTDTFHAVFNNNFLTNLHSNCDKTIKQLAKGNKFKWLVYWMESFQWSEKCFETLLLTNLSMHGEKGSFSKTGVMHCFCN